MTEAVKKIKTPLESAELSKLKAGEKVLISGDIYTARDQAHKKLVGMIEKKETLPFETKGAVIFYAGPTPGKDSLVGAIGPTTASRMDDFTEPLLELGVKGLIGKGPRSQKIKEMLKKNKAVYFVATGGVAALLSEKVRNVDLVAFPELGPEAVLRLEVENFPVVVGCDSEGGDAFFRKNS